VKRLIGVVAGIVVGVLIVAAVEAVGHTVFPPPPGLNMHDPEQLKSLMAKLPIGALLLVVVGWALGPLGGGFVAAKVAGTLRAALSVGVLLTLAGVWTMVEIPHPIWMWVLGVLIPVPMAAVGARFAGVPTVTHQA